MKNLWEIFKSSFKISPMYYVFILINLVFYTANALILVYTPNLIISKLEADAAFKEVVIYSLGIVSLNLALSIATKYTNFLVNYRKRYVSMSYHYLMADKVLSISYDKLEDPNILELKERAIFAAENQGAVDLVLTSGLSTIQSVVMLVSLIVVMAQLGYVLVLVAVAYLVLYTIMSLLLMKTQISFVQRIVPINRQFGYYIDTLANTNCAKDYRIYEADKMVLGRTDKFQSDVCNEFRILFSKLSTITGITSASKGAIEGGIYLYIARQLFKGKILASSFSLYSSSALSFINESSNLVTNILNTFQGLYFLAPYMEMLSLPNEKEDGKKIELNGEIETIEFKNVSFTYPRQSREALTDISFKINKGECISIVGLNGAGKSTLIKLLCRLYQPTKGEILVNGINISDYDIDSYNKHISCVFQDFKLFGYSIKENIAANVDDEEGVYSLLSKLGMKDKIDSLPEGINTLLNKQLDDEGVEVSGGQAQKLAIARALYKNSEIVILDEPTSALDPKSEADIYENFNTLTKDKTALYISHRMSSSTFCDKILVIDGGKITDFDSHENLMKKDCLYHTLFTKQAMNYQN